MSVMRRSMSVCVCVCVFACGCVCVLVCMCVCVCVCVCIYRHPLPTLRACHLAPAIALITCAFPAPRHPYMLCPHARPCLDSCAAAIAHSLPSPHSLSLPISSEPFFPMLTCVSITSADAFYMLAPTLPDVARKRLEKAKTVDGGCVVQGAADAQLCGPSLKMRQKHQWSSGRIHRCHRCDSGSIPG
jgi:hypothetical protein